MFCDLYQNGYTPKFVDITEDLKAYDNYLRKDVYLLLLPKKMVFSLVWKVIWRFQGRVEWPLFL